MKEHRAARLQQILVHEAENVHVVLRSDGRGDDGVIVVDHLLQRAHRQRRPAKVIYLLPFLLVFLLTRLLRKKLTTFAFCGGSQVFVDLSAGKRAAVVDRTQPTISPLVLEFVTCCHCVTVISHPCGNQPDCAMICALFPRPPCILIRRLRASKASRGIFSEKEFLVYARYFAFCCKSQIY